MWWITSTLALFGCDPDQATDGTDTPSEGTAIDADNDGVISGDDCDDADPDRFPGNPEVCDGVDNDCDTEVDEDAVDATAFYRDADGEGFGDDSDEQLACTAPEGFVARSGDCDDTSDLRTPDADEVCDKIDNDCDTEVDEDAVDRQAFYDDIDEDGYGDPATAVLACTSPAPALVDNAEDCDDGDPAVRPGVPDPCDAVDQDCDGAPGPNGVPAIHPTVQDAIDAVPDGEQICVAPGRYPDAFDLGDRSVHIVSAQGSAVTTFDLSAPSSLPFVQTTYGGTSEITGFTFEGLDTDTKAPGEGVILHGDGSKQAAPQPLTLRDVVFRDLRADERDGRLIGQLLHQTDGNLRLENVTVDDVELGFGGDDMYVRGGFLGANGGVLEIDGLVVTGFAVDATGGSYVCLLYGGLVNASSSQVSISGLDVSGSTIDWRCSGSSGGMRAAFVELYVADVTGADWSFRDNVATAYGSSAWAGSLFNSAATDLVLDGAEFLDNTIQADGGNSARVGTVLTLAGQNYGPSRTAVVDHVTIHGNQVLADASSTFETADTGGLVVSSFASAMVRWLDVRDNIALGRGQGGGVRALRNGRFRIENGIIAGNRVGDGTYGSCEGGGLYAQADAGDTIELVNMDIVYNEVWSDPAEGGGIFLAAPSGAVTIQGVNLVGNTVADNDFGAAVDTPSPPSIEIDWTHTNTFDNPGSEPIWGVWPLPEPADGNLTVDPAFVDVTSPDPAVWDLRLLGSSPLVDAGDPTILDVDGSPQDIGAYGGPGGDGW